MLPIYIYQVVGIIYAARARCHCAAARKDASTKARIQLPFPFSSFCLAFSQSHVLTLNFCVRLFLILSNLLVLSFRFGRRFFFLYFFFTSLLCTRISTHTQHTNDVFFLFSFCRLDAVRCMPRFLFYFPHFDLDLHFPFFFVCTSIRPLVRSLIFLIRFRPVCVTLDVLFDGLCRTRSLY